MSEWIIQLIEKNRGNGKMNPVEASADRLSLLRRIKALLEPAFGSRLRGVVLYGSEARGEATPDSDIDVLVLLTNAQREGIRV